MKSLRNFTTTMVQKTKAHGLLLLLLAAFAIAVWPHLSYSFYWDESWSYAPGVRLMYDHGPSLMPNAIDTFYSRGHPLFFYAATAAFLHLLGGYSYFKAHLFALVVTIALLIAVYAFVNELVSKQVALITVVAMAVQVAFFVQASYVLPEIMVALFSFVAISAFATQRYLLSGIALTLLVFTKESGAVAAFVLGVAAFLQLFDRNQPAGKRIAGMAAAVTPLLLIGSFFLLQRHLLGWYLFPGHIGMIVLDWPIFYGKFHDSLAFLLVDDQRKTLVKVFLLLAIITAISKKQLTPLFIALPFLISYLLVRDKMDFLPGKLRVVFVLASWAVALWWLCSRNLKDRPMARRMLLLGVPFIVLYLSFCSINFFTGRYLLTAFVFVMIAITVALYWLISLFNKKWAFYLSGIFVVVVGLIGFRKDTGLGDMHLQSFNAMTVQDKTVRFLEGQQWYNRQIGIGVFQDQEHLTKPYTGFRHTADVFRNVRYEMDSLTEVAVFNNIEPDIRYKKIRRDPSYKRAYRVAKGEAWAEVYTRR